MNTMQDQAHKHRRGIIEGRKPDPLEVLIEPELLIRRSTAKPRG